ncbi:MAG: type I 3-dehydroquinate dehydratase [bacterium]|nr:type I 3-dehydroquinate dehydratase [bacterium]
MKGLIDKENIAVVLTGDQDKKTLKNVIRNAGWIELRFDCFVEKFPGRDYCEWAKKVRNLTDAKIIGTIRWHKERQNKDFIIPDNKRLEMFSSIADYVNFFDIEINSSIAKDVCKIAGNKGINIILSYHNFKTTPSQRKLNFICQKASRLNPSIIKIATLVKTTKDLFRLVSIALSQKTHRGFVLVPMGCGTLERLVPLAFGSLFTYFATNQKTAPGQPAFKDLTKIKKCL